MIETVTEYNTFWFFIFTFLGLVVITIGIVLVKGKDNNLFGNIFNKSSDNTKDITLDINDKFSKAHTEVITCLPQHYEDELHSLEKAVKNTDDKIIALAEDVNKKLDIIIERIVILENNNKDN